MSAIQHVQPFMRLAKLHRNTFPPYVRDILVVLSCLGLFSSGCNSRESESTKTPVAAGPPAALRVAVVDDPAFSAVLERQWNARATQPIDLSQLTHDELLERVKKRRLQADVIIYPTGLLGELASAEVISPIGEASLDSQAYQYRDVLELLRRQEMMWGRQTFAVSFGSPEFVLYYRQDLFEAAGLAPPLDWESYALAVEKLKSLAASDASSAEPASSSSSGADAGPGSSWKPVLEPLAPGWASQVLLARAAAYARHRGSYSTLFNYATLEPLIQEASFVRALEELVAANKADSAASLAATPNSARRAFHRGEYAMVWSWPTAADGELPRMVAPGQIGLAPLPGSRQVYNFRDERWETRPGEAPERVPLLGIAGRLASVTKETRYQREAIDMVLLLTNQELGAELSPVNEVTTVFRRSQLPQARAWCEPQLDSDDVSAFVELTKATQEASSWLMSPNLPGRREYLAALDEAVRAALQGTATPQEALATTAEKWREISQQHGESQQRIAYERSLGLEE